MSLTRVFQGTGRSLASGPTGIRFWTRNYAAKSTSTTTSAGTGIQSLGKGAAKGAKGGPKAAKAVPVLEKAVLPVETDPNKLVTYLCGSNLLKEGGENVKLKPDEEYPDWLWQIRKGPAPSPDEMEFDSPEYWKRVRRLAHTRHNSFRHLKKF